VTLRLIYIYMYDGFLNTKKNVCSYVDLVKFVNQCGTEFPEQTTYILTFRFILYS